MIVRVAMHLTVDRNMLPSNQPIHDALLSVRAVEVEAPTIEVGEHYGDLVLKALIKTGNS